MAPEFRDGFERRTLAPSDTGSGPSADATDRSAPMPTQEELERTANYEGNHTELMFTRLRHPVIKRQMAELIQKERFTRNISSEIENIENRLEREMSMLERDTPITFDPNEMPNANKGREKMSPLWKGFEIQAGAKPTTQILSITEAHEKGHVIRPYDSEFYVTHFSPGFDFTKAIFTSEDYRKYRTIPKMPDIPFERYKEGMLDYLSSGGEIVERMGQLKNYFGMRGDEQFTKAHLAYARAHYIDDTNSDNGMTQFFQSITPETEAEFLRLINTSGI